MAPPRRHLTMGPARGAKEVILGTLAMRGAGCWRTLRVGRLNRPSLSRPPGRLRAQLARSAAKRSPPDPPALDWSASGGLFGLHHCRSNSVARCLRRRPAQGRRRNRVATADGRQFGGCRAVLRGRAAWLGEHRVALDTATSDHLLATLQAEGPVEVTSTYLNLPTYNSACLAIGCIVKNRDRIYSISENGGKRLQKCGQTPLFSSCTRC